MSDYILLGADEEPATLELLARRTSEIIRLQHEDAARRRWTLIIAGASALFAAVKLGVIVLPHIRRHRAQEL